MIIDGGRSLTFEEGLASAQKAKEEALSRMSPKERAIALFKSLFYRPRHQEDICFGKSIEECLRKLEKEVGLPARDLSLTGGTSEGGNLFATGTRHFFRSRTSEEWKRFDRPGYVAGDVFEVKDFPSRHLFSSAAIAHALAVSEHFVGSIHVSRNCKGVAAEGKCTYCGYTFSH